MRTGLVSIMKSSGNSLQFCFPVPSGMLSGFNIFPKGYVKQLLGMIDTLKQTLDTVSASNRRNEELVKKLSAQIEELQRLVKNLEDRDRRHNKNAFGQKTHKAKKRVEDGRANGENANGKQDRDEEREDYDGSHDSSKWFTNYPERKISINYLEVW